jgi:hypothetical protein
LSHLNHLYVFLCLVKPQHIKSRVDTLHGAVVEQRDKDTEHSEGEGMNNGGNPLSVGYMGKGFHTARLAWAKLESIFMVGGVLGKEEEKTGTTYATIERSPDNLLCKKPVDLLVVDSVSKSDYETTSRNKKGNSKWLRQVRRAKGTGKEPKIVVESWGDQTLFDEDNGPTSKRHRSLWESKGYISRVHRWEAAKLNSALRQERVVVLRIARGLGA